MVDGEVEVSVNEKLIDKKKFIADKIIQLTNEDKLRWYRDMPGKYQYRFDKRITEGTAGAKVSDSVYCTMTCGLFSCNIKIHRTDCPEFHYARYVGVDLGKFGWRVMESIRNSADKTAQENADRVKADRNEREEKFIDFVYEMLKGM